MRGDFSNWRLKPQSNFSGVLQQQGKVSLDADGTTQTRLNERWHQQAARDWVGPVAAVAAADANDFNVTAASLNADGTVGLTLNTGHIWADGLLVFLAGTGSAQRTATWLAKPLVAKNGAKPKPGDVDIVVLEVWQEAVNGFQWPDVMMEPALGGPDTAEMLNTGYDLRLVRVDAGQTCKNVKFDESGLGRLTATLAPPTVTTGDCPVPDGGGYSGFEHCLYRIEIADVPSGSGSAFKWSRMNGGLVGRGSFDPTTNVITITANLTAITSDNQANFYAEIEQWDPNLGCWTIVCGGNVNLSNGALQFTAPPAPPTFGTYPAAAGPVFFRLWDGLEQISAFQTTQPLENGISLLFDPDGVGVYQPHDYWLFAVRAGGIPNPQTLIDDEQPQGIEYHRVPLAEITWGGSTSALTATIEDCRATIQPLTETCGCCTVEVGDGVTSFAEFTSIQAAIDSLPAEGGEVCVLAGLYFEQIKITTSNVILRGCGEFTRIADPSLQVGSKSSDTNPVILVKGCDHIQLLDFAVESNDGHVGIDIEGLPETGPSDANDKAAYDILCRDLIVVSTDNPGIFVNNGFSVRIERCMVAMSTAFDDVSTNCPAIYLSGQEIRCVENWVGMFAQSLLPNTVLNDFQAVLLAPQIGTQWLGTTAVTKIPGGIQIGGTSEDVYVERNQIEGGSGNGVTLGSVTLIDTTTGFPTGIYYGIDPWGGDLGGDCGSTIIVTGGGSNTTTQYVVEGTLTNIHINDNRIRNMGMCGIGPIAFFDIADTQEIVSVDGLYIINNEITACVARKIGEFRQTLDWMVGFAAVSLPDVANLVIRDNAITDTGATLADPVCGIFVLHGQQVEISRNQILDTRDWSRFDAAAMSGLRVGISISLVTPIPVDGLIDYTLSIADRRHKRVALYDPTPALIIHENVVDVPAGMTLSVFGLGAFSIRGNHFATKATVEQPDTILASSILIMNLGSPIEVPWVVNRASDLLLLLANLNEGEAGWPAFGSAIFLGESIVGSYSNGPVLFAENQCTASSGGEQRRDMRSILIMTFDDLGFYDNQCVNVQHRESKMEDVLLIAITMRATGSRIQERFGTMPVSLVTLALVNITAFNICSAFLLSNTGPSYYALNEFA